MTPDEIQALREKHRPVEIGLADLSTVDYPERHQKIITCRICTMGDGGKIMSYPCDVIKVLNAWEAERSINIGQMLNSYFNAPIYTNEDYDL